MEAGAGAAPRTRKPGQSARAESSQGVFRPSPYCAILQDYLSDTPLLRAMGFLVSQHGQLGAIPPPPFLSVSPLESMRSGGAVPCRPHQRGISAILARYPLKTRQMGAIPLSVILSRKGIARYGGGSRTGPLRSFPDLPKGPSRTKNTTESEFRYGESIRYGNSKTLRRGPRNAGFSRQRKGRKMVQTAKNYEAAARYYGSGRAVRFLVRKGPCPDLSSQRVSAERSFGRSFRFGGG